MENYIALTITLSFFLQVSFSRYYFDAVVNPVSIFSMLHFFHNWSQFAVNYFGLNITFPVPYNITAEDVNAVALINLFGGWAFFISCVLFFKNNTIGTDKPFELSIVKYNKYYKAYYFLYVLTLIEALLNGKLSIVYGGSQAISSSEAFTPIGSLLNTRIIFGSVYLIVNNLNVKKSKYLILSELLITCLLGGRKGFVILFLAYILPRLTRLDSKTVIKLIIIFPFLAMSISFLGAFRAFSSLDLDLKTKISLAIELAFFNENYSIFRSLTMANSESVQSWVYALHKIGELDLLYGLSYAQGLINTFLLRPFQGDFSAYQAAYYFKSRAYPYVTTMGYDFSFTAEAILNFGVYFSWFPFFLLGLFVIYNYNRRFNSINYILYWLVWPVLFITFRSDFTNMMRYLSVFLFFNFIVYCLSKERFN